MPGALRSTSTILAIAWSTKLLSGPPANAMPPVTVTGSAAVEAELALLHAHRRREAAVELARGHVASASAGDPGRRSARVREAGAAVEVAPRASDTMVFASATASG